MGSANTGILEPISSKKLELSCLVCMRSERKASEVRQPGQWQHRSSQPLLTVLHILPAALMQFMGDQPKPRSTDELALLYELLKVRTVCQP